LGIPRLFLRLRALPPVLRALPVQAPERELPLLGLEQPL